MATIVTKSDAAVHVLEFLAGLSRLSDMARSFHGEEIKVVFGVCFSYIEYVRGKRYDEAQQRTRSNPSSRHASAAIDSAVGQHAVFQVDSEDVAQYVYALAYHVIIFWHLTMKNDDQKKYSPWMQQRLVSADQSGTVEEQALVTLDLIWRTTRTDITTIALDSPSPVHVSGSSWVSTYAMVTIESAMDKTVTKVVERRASGTDEWTILNPAHSDAETLFRTHFEGGIDGPLPSDGRVEFLPETDASDRTLALLDRVSAVDFLKAGVVYIGEKQTSEKEILSNVMGSPDYILMVKGLGSRLKLQGLKQNTAGLDTSEAQTDGSYTIWHREEVTALIYHITTIMPTNTTIDADCIRKKAHIGNDYVNIVFNNSGGPFNFDTFPSAFNFVYILVTPEARATFIETRTRKRTSQTEQTTSSNPDSSEREPGWYHKAWFKVQVVTRADFPTISSAAQTKVVSGRVLAQYVRNLALNACVFCNVWANRETAAGGGTGEYPSSWRARLVQLRRLRERYGVEWK